MSLISTNEIVSKYQKFPQGVALTSNSNTVMISNEYIATDGQGTTARMFATVNCVEYPHVFANLKTVSDDGISARSGRVYNKFTSKGYVADINNEHDYALQRILPLERPDMSLGTSIDEIELNAVPGTFSYREGVSPNFATNKITLAESNWIRARDIKDDNKNDLMKAYILNETSKKEIPLFAIDRVIDNTFRKDTSYPDVITLEKHGKAILLVGTFPVSILNKNNEKKSIYPYNLNDTVVVGFANDWARPFVFGWWNEPKVPFFDIYTLQGIQGQAGASSTVSAIVFNHPAASDVDGFYNRQSLSIFYGGWTGAMESKFIVSYDGSTRTAYVDPPFNDAGGFFANPSYWVWYRVKRPFWGLYD